MRTSVLSDRSWASSRMMTLYRSKSPSLSDSRSKTPSVISGETLVKKDQREVIALTFDLRLFGSAILKTNRISDRPAQFTLHQAECQPGANGF